MKNLVLLLLLCIPFCSQAQIREKRDVSAFTKISFRIPGKIFLRQGTSNSLEISASPEQLSRIETEVEDGKLIIQPKNPRDWKYRSDYDNIRIYITVREITSISVAGSGHVRTDEKIKTENLDLDMAGSGSIYLQGDAESLTTRTTGSGSIELAGSATGLDADISGSGSVRINTLHAESILCDISGSGNVDLSGKSRNLKVTIAGSGRVHAFDLTSSTVRVKIAGSGDVQVTATETIDAQIAGSGKVHYKGNPQKINSNSTGSGKIKKAED